MSGVIHAPSAPAAVPSAFASKASGSVGSGASKRPSSVYGLIGEGGRKSSSDGGDVAHSASVGLADAQPSSPGNFEAGRAEALGALCRCAQVFAYTYLLLNAFIVFYSII